MRAYATGICVALALLPAYGQKGKPAAFESPASGSALRAQILAQLRARTEREVGKPVVFVVRLLRVKDGWAFVHAEPQRKGGKPIDFRKIPDYKELIDQGIFDGPALTALLHQEKGVWKTKAFIIGPTDVAWADWPERFHAPAAIFDLPR